MLNAPDVRVHSLVARDGEVHPGPRVWGGIVPEADKKPGNRMKGGTEEECQVFPGQKPGAQQAGEPGRVAFSWPRTQEPA